MIRLIATDLDGTLLRADSSLPEETFPLIEKLHARNILFCVASGRQYAGLVDLFAPVADKVLFLAENGAYVAYQDETLYQENIPRDRIVPILNVVRSLSGAHPLLCCQNCAYAEDNYPPFLTECTKYYPRFQRLADLNKTPVSDPVCKIAVFDDRGSAEFSGKTLPPLLPDFRVVVSGKVWSDVSLPTTNKGTAMREIQRRLRIPPNECMAFGDYMNDYELLAACTHSYVPENGFPPLIEKIGRTILPNTQDGVIRKIKETIGEEA